MENYSLTGTAAIRVGLSTVQSPLLPFLIDQQEFYNIQYNGSQFFLIKYLHRKYFSWYHVYSIKIWKSIHLLYFTQKTNV